MTTAQLVGWLATFVGAVVGFPQLWRLVRTRNVEGLSLVAWQWILVMNIIWFAHGLRIDQPPQEARPVVPPPPRVPVSGGIQRPLIRRDRGGVGALLGYRLGFVTGYDGRLMSFARKTPVLPLVQPFFSLDYHRIGVEVSYTFVVVSGAASYRF